MSDNEKKVYENGDTFGESDNSIKGLLLKMWNNIKQIGDTEVVWFPENDLATPEKPFLLPDEEFKFETITLKESAKRIYNKEYDFEKLLRYTSESTALSVTCCFFLGTFIGGAASYWSAKNEVQEDAKQYIGQNLSKKKRAQIYNDGARFIRKRVSQNAAFTGLRFAILTGAFGYTNYGLMKYRRKSDPLNFTAGGAAMGLVGGVIQSGGNARGILYATSGMAGVGLAIGCMIEAANYISKYAESAGTQNEN